MSYISIVKKETPTTPTATGYKSIITKSTTTTPETPKTKISTLQPFLGGGSYNTVIGEPNTLLKTKRGYAGVPSSSETERHHIIPVEFGGDSTMDKNIIALGDKAHQRITNGESVISSDYKAGKISLPQARLKIMGLLQKEQDEAKGVTTSVGKNLLNIVKENIQKLAPKNVAKEVVNLASQLKGKSGPIITQASQIASKETGKNITPQNYAQETKKLPLETRNVIKTQTTEQLAEQAAKVATAPIRYTAGSLATATASYSLEKANSEGKYTPQTDAEKLLIGENDIQRLLKQEDLYGTIARGAGVPTALLAIAVIENPFIKDTGVGTLIREGLEKRIKSKILAKLGTEEIIKIANDAIKAEVKAGKIAEKEAIKLSNSIKGIKVKETTPASIVEPQKPTGEVLIPKTTKPLTPSKTTKTDPLNFKTAEDYVFDVISGDNKTGNAYDSFKGLVKNKKTSDFISQKDIQFTEKSLKGKITAGQEISQKVVDTWKTRILNGERPIVILEDTPYKVNILKPTGERSILTIDNRVRQGHHRLEAYKQLGIKEVPTVTKSQLISEWNKAQEIKPIKPKVEPIKYVPEEKPVDLRKKITTERLIAEPSVPNRIKDEVIEKGLKADFGGISDYDKVSFKDQAKKVGEIIDEDPEKAIRIALGKELPTNGALPESVFMAVKNKAIENGDTELLIRLATEEGGVAKESTVLGQRIKMLDEQLEDDAFRNINQVVKARRAKLEKSGVSIPKAKSAEINKIKSEIVKAKPKKDEWLAFIDEIEC